MQAKYKAWHVEEQVMYHDPIINGMNGLVVRVYNNEIVGHYAADEIILLQYTGVKDINGLEICEGHVIEEPDFSAGAVLIGGSQPRKRIVVKFEVGDTIGKKAGYNLRLGFVNGMYKGEIIGNIYENPELLEVKLYG